MKKGHLILGILLLFALFVFIPAGVAGHVGYDELKKYCSDKCFWESDEEASEESMNKCWIECMSKGETTPEMALTVNTDKKTYSLGESVWVDGSVKDAEGNDILEVDIHIKVEGTDLSTSTSSRIVYDMDGGGGSRIGYITPRLSIPFDFLPGTYTVKATASKTGYQDVSRTTSFTVGSPTISLCPSTVPGGDVERTIEIKGTGFGANEQILDIVLRTGKVAGAGGMVVASEISADADGSFRVKCDIPIIAPNIVGQKHIIDATGTLHTANAEFTVGLSINEIRKIYYEWGEKPYMWPDGSTDKHALFHHNRLGGLGANARQGIVRLPDEKQEASHFGCIACQWKTLYFFVQQGKNDNLGGWEFMPLFGWSPTPSEALGHHAVVLYPAHAKWQTDGWVFDPHPTGEPKGSVKHITHWDDWRFRLKFDDGEFVVSDFGGKMDGGSFVRDYTKGCIFSKAYKYPYCKNPKAYVYDHWMTPEETEKYRVEYNKLHGSDEAAKLVYDPNPFFNMRCPVNVLVVNSAGERLGLTENDDWVSEFKPEKFDTWPGDDNTPVWYIELPKGDVYTILITGTGSGDLEVFAAPEGSRVVFKYPPVEVSARDKFSMKLDADDPGTPLDTPSGQVSPTEIPIEEYIAIVEPTKDNHPPTASFSIMPQNPKTSDTIVVASTSFDPDDDKLTYSWYRNGSEIGNSPNWEWENPQAGEHNIKLVVDDGKGGSAEDSRKINVEEISTDTPGFEIALPIGAIVVALIIIKRRKHNL